jgi:hypothetical protein
MALPLLPDAEYDLDRRCIGRDFHDFFDLSARRSGIGPEVELKGADCS